MGQLADDARVTVLLADYIGVDASGKINALGAGFTLAAVGPNGMTAPQHLAVMIDLPSKHAGAEFALLLELRDDKTGMPVRVVGPSGALEPLRIQQVMRGERPTIAGAHIPESVPVRVQLTMGFPTGLQLAAGGSYVWRVEIEGQHREDWDIAFHVLGPPPGPVFGGPVGPADITMTPPPDLPDP